MRTRGVMKSIGASHQPVVNPWKGHNPATLEPSDPGQKFDQMTLHASAGRC